MDVWTVIIQTFSSLNLAYCYIHRQTDRQTDKESVNFVDHTKTTAEEAGGPTTSSYWDSLLKGERSRRD